MPIEVVREVPPVGIAGLGGSKKPVRHLSKSAKNLSFLRKQTYSDCVRRSVTSVLYIKYTFIHAGVGLGLGIVPDHLLPPTI